MFYIFIYFYVYFSGSSDSGAGWNTPVTHVPVPIVVPEDTSKSKVHKILKDKKERINVKNTRLYLVRYKRKSSDKDEWIPKDNIPDGPIHLRNYRVSKRNWEKKFHYLA